MALSIPANLNLLGYELAEKFAASAEYCEPLEVNSESRVETETTSHPQPLFVRLDCLSHPSH